MVRCVAFLRAINVGGHTVRMEKLRDVFEKEGLSNVETVIASGNVVFDTRSPKSAERQIEKALESALGYGVATFVRPVSAMSDVADLNPFGQNAEGTLYVGFLSRAPSAAAREKLLIFASSLESFHFSGRELYWLTRSTFRDSKISGALIEKTLGMQTTLRNINTVRRIAAKYS